jgi:Rod binding domain-containing protein
VTDFLPTRPVAGLQPATPAKSELRAVAEKLEAGFLAEMLKSAGVGEQDNSFSGSAGESQFASFQREAFAREMVASGGIGLADIFHANLKDKTNDS